VYKNGEKYCKKEPSKCEVFGWGRLGNDRPVLGGPIGT